MKIEYKNRTYEIKYVTKLIDDRYTTSFYIDVDNVMHPIDASLTSDISYQPNDDDLFDRLVSEEAMMLLFEMDHNVKCKEVVSGKRPELVVEWVRVFGTQDLYPEAHEEYFRLMSTENPL